MLRPHVAIVVALLAAFKSLQAPPAGQQGGTGQGAGSCAVDSEACRSQDAAACVADGELCRAQAALAGTAVDTDVKLTTDIDTNAALDMIAAVAKHRAGFRRSSRKPECQATPGPRDDPHFMSRVRPCGNYSSVCTDIPVVEANKDYPGGGIGAVRPNQDYVVQFDIGLHPVVARDILTPRLREIMSCLHCPSFEEQCLETVVTGGAMWGNLGMSKLNPRSYDCMGGCGRGCSNVGRTREDVGALDCLKHDLCSAWKSVRSGTAAKGYCHDPDCGDEAAMALFNCWRGFRLFGSLGGNRKGPFSVPVICDREDPKIRGCWSHGGWFTQGRCKVFQGWERGQGIPDPHPLRSPIQRL